MSKKLIALTLTAALTLSSIVPAFAEESISANAQAAKDLGMLKGANSAGVTVEYTKTAPTRLQAAILFLRLKGLESAALSYTGTSNFADAKDVVWAEGKNVMAYLKAHPELGWAGIGNDKFNPNAQVDAKSYYKVMLEALGYKQNTADVIGDFTWDNIVAFAASKGLDDVMSVANFTVDNVATATIEALKAAIKGSEKTLAASLVEAKIINEDAAVKAGVYTKAPLVFAVDSVVANNLKTVRINFNKAVDKDSISASTLNMYVNNSNVSLTLNTNMFLSEDKKSVVITNTFQQSDSIKITVNGLKAVDGTKAAEYTTTSVVTDITVPTIESIAAVNAKQIEVFFNEPMNLATSSVFNAYSNIKIDGDIIVATITPDYTKNSIVLGLPTALKAGSHTIAIADVYDYANFKALAKDFTFSIADDVTAPEILSAKAVNVNTIELTFNESLSQFGTIKVNNEVAAVTPVANSNNTKVTLTGFTPLTLSAIVQVKIAYVDQADVVGNKVATEKSFTFQVADDTTLPTVSTVVGDLNKLTMTFSKSMNTAAGTITIQDKDENVNTLAVNGLSFTGAGSAVWSENNTVLTITGALNGLNPQNVKVAIKDMKDATIRANILPETNLTLAVGDTSVPTVHSYYKTAAGTTAAEDTITFYFNEAMDLDTMKNLSNYVGSTVTTLAAQGATVKSVAADSKSITFKVNGIAAKATAGETFTVYAIKDAAGNMMASTSVSNLPLANIVSIKSVESTDGSKVKVTFDGTNIASVNPAALKVVLASDPTSTYATFTSVSGITYNAAANESYVTFTANRSLGTNPDQYDVAILSGSLIKDIYGTSVSAITAANIEDKVVPTVTVATGDATGQIKLTFSEAVNATDLATLKQDIVVRDENGAIVDLTGKVSYFVGSSAGSVTNFNKLVINGTSGKRYTVQVVGRSIVDLSANANVVTDVPTTAVTVK